MAWYYNQEVRVRGRIVSVSFRSGAYNGASVQKGKPLTFTRSVKRAIRKALNRPHKAKERADIEHAIQSMLD